MGSSQQLEVEWSRHQSNLSAAFSAQQHDQTFVDVTLVCSGGNSTTDRSSSVIKAHRNVLAASSPFLRDIFVDNPSAHPVIVLHGLQHRGLSALVEFMYSGRISTTIEQLQAILTCAHSLHVDAFIDACNLHPLLRDHCGQQEPSDAVISEVELEQHQSNQSGFWVNDELSEINLSESSKIGLITSVRSQLIDVDSSQLPRDDIDGVSVANPVIFAGQSSSIELVTDRRRPNRRRRKRTEVSIQQSSQFVDQPDIEENSEVEVLDLAIKVEPMPPTSNSDDEMVEHSLVSDGEFFRVTPSSRRPSALMAHLTCSNTAEARAVYDEHSKPPIRASDLEKPFSGQLPDVRTERKRRGSPNNLRRTPGKSAPAVTAQKPNQRFQCRLCNKTFGALRCLKAHAQLHNPYRKTHACTLCTRVYQRRGELLRHFKVFHPDVPIPYHQRYRPNISSANSGAIEGQRLASQ